MASNGSSVPSDLSKLTVPQLKALCKERRITGYSKLGKAALLQKLVEVVTPTKRTTLSNDQASRNATEAPSIVSTNEVRNTANSFACIKSSTACREGDVTTVVHQLAQSSTLGNTEPRGTSTRSPKISQSSTITKVTSTQRTVDTKRPAHIDISGPPKRIKVSLESTTNTDHEPSVTRTSTPQQQLPADSATFKVPKLPVQHKRSFRGSASTLATRPSGARKRNTLVTGGAERFKPLVVSRPNPVEHDQVNKEPSRAPSTSIIPRPVDSAEAPNSHTRPLPIFSYISFPPKASERKWVHRWAIILSALPPSDRQTCTLVSRTFRYAVYLSAVYILSRNYAGRRSDVVLELHSRNMTNFWPYLRLRMAEVSERRRAFKLSFLGQYADSIGYDPLSERLWTSPDDEKQVDVAIRFVLTRMWFAVSVGAYGHDASTWSRCTIRDVREVVKGEIWQVIAHDNSTGESCGFHVLEATCEVIGQTLSSYGKDTLGYSLRADWTARISQRSQVPQDTGPCSLLEHVKWSNTEDYHRGISKAWLCRVQGQDTNSISKKTVAEKYILASVVANGISGQWMSTTAMAQEFAGLPGTSVNGSGTAGRSVNTVNMYLPAHHHVESVHFTTIKGKALHPAVAVVQTPGQEYYILRDNGMQIGSEEEGIAKVWQQILGCNTLGQVQL